MKLSLGPMGDNEQMGRWTDITNYMICTFTCAMLFSSSLALFSNNIPNYAYGSQASQYSLSCSIAPSTEAVRSVITNDVIHATELTANDFFNTGEMPYDAPQDPYPIFGYTTYYDGSAGAMLYNPGQAAYGRLDPGTSVSVTWRNSSALAPVPYSTITVVSDPLTAQFCVDLLYYHDGDPVWINATSAGWGNNGYNHTTIDTIASPGGRRQDVMCGVPFSLAVASFPTQVNISEVFTLEYQVLDRDGALARGYFTPNPPGPIPDGNMDFHSNDSMFVNDPVHPLQFNGLSSPTPGMALATLAFGTPGYHWLNISEGGAFESNPYLTPWGAFYLHNGTPGFGNDWANVTLYAMAPPLLSVAKDAPATIIAGSTMLYRIRIENIGTGNAENITLIEQFPPWTEFLNATPPPNIGNNTWIGVSSGGHLPDLAPLESFVIFINLSVSSTTPMGTVLLNSIIVNLTDSNGTYLPEIRANASSIVVYPAISLIKTAPISAFSSLTIPYIITYQNLGTSMAYNVWINETYPPDAFFLNSNPVPNVSNNAWYIGNLTPGSSGTIFINMTTDAYLANGTVLDNWIFCVYTPFLDNYDAWLNASDNAETIVLLYTGIPNSYYNGNIILNTTGIWIGDYDLRDPVLNQSMLNRQIYAGHEYYFYVNLYGSPNALDVNNVAITAWHDKGNELTEYGTGSPNTEFAIRYHWYNSTFSLTSTYTTGDPEIRDVWGLKSQPNPNQLQLYFYFTIGEQIRHAPGEGLWHNATGIWDTSSAFNDLLSWNFRISVLTNNSLSANAFDEFGVCAFTRISVSDLFAKGLPGQMVAFPSLILNYSSNDDYRLGVYLNRTLTKISPMSTPYATIGETNISTSAGILPKTYFDGIGPSFFLYYYPMQMAPEWGTNRNLLVQFWVFVPINVPGGTYQGELIYVVEHI
jgi:hypothetical protein